MGGVSHKISFDSFRNKNKNKNKKTANHSPLFSTLKGGNNEGEEKKRKERATKEGMPKGGRGQDCLFLLRRGSGKERMGIKTK